MVVGVCLLRNVMLLHSFCIIGAVVDTGSVMWLLQCKG